MSDSSDNQTEWFLYIVRCGDQSLYTGVTNDLTRRFAEHTAQGPKTAKYLRGRGPLRLVFQMSAGDRSQALRYEYQVKQLSRQEKEQLVSGRVAFENLKAAS